MTEIVRFDDYFVHKLIYSFMDSETNFFTLFYINGVKKLMIL